MRLRIIALPSIAVAGMGMASLSAPAQAQAGSKDRHCVTDVSAPNTSTTCYDSFTTAIATATRGRVTDAPGDVRRAMRDPKLIAQLNDTSFSPAQSFVLSTEWDASGFSGDSVSFTAPSGCTTDTLDDIEWQVAALPDSLNDISSYLAFSHCRVKHWEHPNFTGRSIGFDGGRADMGDMEASSIQWS
jgi:hypothetical protein